MQLLGGVDKHQLKLAKSCEQNNGENGVLHYLSKQRGQNSRLSSGKIFRI